MTEEEFLRKLHKELATADSFQSIYQVVEDAICGGEPIEFININHLDRSTRAKLNKGK